VAEQAEASAAGQPRLTRDQQEQLARLRWLWPDYRIECDGRAWSAAPWIALDQVLTADNDRDLWDKVASDKNTRDWPPRMGYWVERASGPPFWVDLPDRPRRFRNSG